MNEGGSKAEYFTECGIKCGEFQLFVKKSDDEYYDTEREAACADSSGAVIRAVYDKSVKGGESEFAEQYAVRVDVDIACVAGDKNDGDTEKERKYKADGRIGGDKPASVEGFYQPDSEDTHECRTDNQ